MLTNKQQRFCEEYVVDWNATRAAIKAGYSEKTARQIGQQNLTKVDIKAYISEIQYDLQRLAGVSALRNILELKKLAYTSIAAFKQDWMTEKEFDELTDDQKAAISEIMTIDKTDKQGNPVKIVKFKLHDKLKAIEMINKMLGFNAPDKHEHSGPNGGPIKNEFTGFDFLPGDDSIDAKEDTA